MNLSEWGSSNSSLPYSLLLFFILSFPVDFFLFLFSRFTACVITDFYVEVLVLLQLIAGGTPGSSVPQGTYPEPLHCRD